MNTKPKELLIIPGNKNEGTLKNVLAIINLKRNNMIGKVLFLDLDNDTSEENRVNYRKCVEDIFKEKNIEVRYKKIKNCQSEIPSIIADASKEVGKKNVVLDLTNGMKLLTGSLYTAASICELENIYYVEVKKNGNEYYKIYECDNNWNEKCCIKEFKAMDEIYELANINKVEFIFYSKSIESIFEKYKDKEDMIQIRLNYEKAVDDYFLIDGKLNYNTSIRSTGMISEILIGKLVKYLEKKLPKELKDERYKKKFNSKSNVYDKLGIYCGFIRECRKKENKNLSEIKEAVLKSLEELNGCVSIDYMFNTIRCYRNYTSHKNEKNLCKNDAKIALDTIYHILRVLSDNNLLEKIFES